MCNDLGGSRKRKPGGSRRFEVRLPGARASVSGKQKSKDAARLMCVFEVGHQADAQQGKGGVAGGQPGSLAAQATKGRRQWWEITKAQEPIRA